MIGGHGSESQDFVHYAFYKCRSEWRLLPEGVKEQGAAEFLEAVERFRDPIIMETYSTLGLRSDADFLIWKGCPELPPIQEMAAALNRTGLGRYLALSHSLLALCIQALQVAVVLAWFRVALRLADDKPVGDLSAKELLAGYLPFLLTHVLVALIVGAGLILLVVPGVIWAVTYASRPCCARPRTTVPWRLCARAVA